jgi:hypothetical protein
MFKKLTISLVLLFLISFAASLFAQESNVKNSNWYWGFGLGTGQILTIDGTDPYKDYNSKPAISAQLGAGVIINDYFNLGVDLSVLVQGATNKAVSTLTYQNEIDNMFLCAQLDRKSVV